MSPDESLYLDDDELEEETAQDPGELELDPIQALRLRGDYDDEFRDTADFANEKMRAVKRVRERRNVRYSAKKSPEPEWVGDPEKLPKKPPRGARK